MLKINKYVCISIINSSIVLPPPPPPPALLFQALLYQVGEIVYLEQFFARYSNSLSRFRTSLYIHCIRHYTDISLHILIYLYCWGIIFSKFLNRVLHNFWIYCSFFIVTLFDVWTHDNIDIIIITIRPQIVTFCSFLD